MTTIFSKIINGELPGTFVWEDDLCVAFMTIAPMQPGHVLVVPKVEIEHWIDLDEKTLAHVMTVSHIIGKAIEAAYNPEKVALMLAGLEVPHVHIHLLPIWGLSDMAFANADPNASTESIQAAAEKIRVELRAAGHGAPADARL